MTDEADRLNPIRRRLAIATGQMGHVIKDQEAKLPSYSYNYANLNSVMAVVKPALFDQGLILMQPIITRDDMMVVTTLITDINSGDYIMFDGPGFAVKGDPQAAGSAITYYRRYALVTLFGLEAEDDDGGMAHRAAARPGNRTPAEAEVVAIVKALPTVEERNQFKQDFKTNFGSGLSELPEFRHGDALTWAKGWPWPDALDETMLDGEADS